VTERVNFLIEDDVYKLLQKVPQGERSRTVNIALREWAETRRWREAAARMDTLREQLPPAEKGDIVRWIREDRESAH
jgi:predicted CopG family antitoxin